eukprot:CAMPEP_0177693186 /NCGR_PEP_ID=MMETSP0484_2-20121128/2262_1 /TAXON_ID=354590 /ORGANISM="Rhodomonas lens, Strain RHODO" /LENGTH=115 /DNA_ID=CAMNT_0019203973 /DNA_START=169 /DNA_END=516 /DNA_ORIENTATION=-
MMVSPMKEASKSIPLKIEVEEMQEVAKDFNQGFLENIIDRLDWPAFVEAAALLNQEGLPASKELLDKSDELTMKKLHHALMEVDVVTGNLVCTETGRKFPIAAGIPNMLLNQDEL